MHGTGSVSCKVIPDVLIPKWCTGAPEALGRAHGRSEHRRVGRHVRLGALSAAVAATTSQVTAGGGGGRGRGVKDLCGATSA